MAPTDIVETISSESSHYLNHLPAISSSYQRAAQYSSLFSLFLLVPKITQKPKPTFIAQHPKQSSALEELYANTFLFAPNECIQPVPCAPPPFRHTHAKHPDIKKSSSQAVEIQPHSKACARREIDHKIDDLIDHFMSISDTFLSHLLVLVICIFVYFSFSTYLPPSFGRFVIASQLEVTSFWDATRHDIRYASCVRVKRKKNTKQAVCSILPLLLEKSSLVKRSSNPKLKFRGCGVRTGWKNEAC